MRHVIDKITLNLTQFFLIQQGFLNRTPRGREATELAYKHFSVSQSGKADTLFGAL